MQEQGNEIAKMRLQLDELQTQQAFQEDIIATLNRELGLQQAEIARLQRLYDELREQLAASASTDFDASTIERPPHY